MLLNESSFRAQWEYAVLIAERAIEEIRQGYIFPTPLKSGREAHCAYCSAKNICHHAEEYIRLEVKIDPEGICRIVENAMQSTESEETEE